MRAAKGDQPLPIEMTDAESAALLRVADNSGVSPEVQAARLVLEVLARRARGVNRRSGSVKPIKN